MAATLITGANRGLGLAFTRQLLKSNKPVIACCRQPEKANELLSLKQQFNKLLQIEQLEVTNTIAIHGLVEKLTNQPLEMLINNAGIYSIKNKNPQTDHEPWLQFFHTNSVAPYLLAHGLTSNLELANTKKIINISSYMASIALNNNGIEAPYRASKAALNMLTKNLSIELSEKQITVIAIDPGWVRTDMGGPDALLSPDECAIHILNTVNQCTLNDSGKFIKYNGEEMPW